ncbi:MAG: hypothetical protein ACD_43C00189G0002 [uncultured bacterium]|nr:MAG: hypothetical protein ACD_43C00189G0002 [uncultured bacterium]
MTFTSSSTATLDYAVIRYGGATNHATDYPMLKLDSDSTTMSNSTVSDSEYHAIGIMASPTLSNNTVTTAGSSDSGAYITSGSPILTNNTFSNSSCGVYITGTATPTLTTNTFTDNAYPIYLFNPNSGTSLSGNTGSANNVNGIMLVGSTNGDFELNMDNDLLYILASLDISAGDTLTIVPGTVLKFDYASLGSYTASLQYLRGDGTLIARGTVTEPIVFTSISDDSYGGDTNGDMAASSPSPGSWDYISLTGTASISHAIIQYGGSYHSWGPDYAMVQIGSDNVTITNSTISDSEYRGVQINATSPTITNTLINSHDSHWFTKAIYIDGGSPTITNNVITDNKYGVMIMNDALPTISGNTIDSNVNGLNAVSAISLITAENNWWGDASGPYHATSNPTGTGDTVSNNVDYSPWFTLNSDITPPADVTPRLTIRNVWTPALTVRWFNPTDADFNHVQIDRFDGTNTTTVSNNATGTTYIDTTVNYNIRYSYTLYAVDTSGNVSSGISPTAVGLRNPAPANLLLVSGDSAITATWSRSSSSSAMLGGYIVQYGTAPDALTNTVDVGNVTTTTLTGLANGTTYYVAVRAYSTSAVQSSLSTVQSATPQP